MTETLSVRDLSRATLARQMLLARETTTVPRALERLLAVQSQWPKPPFVAFWSRLEGFTRDGLSELAKKNAVVRGTAFRGTIFLMLPKDYAAFRASIQPTLERGLISVAGKHVPEKERDAVVTLARKFFAKTPASFDALRDELAKRGHENARIRAEAYVARLRIPLLQVATDVDWGWHGQCDFALAESMVKEPIATELADDALVLRYLAALGPATVADAQNFLGVTKLKYSFARLRDKLVVFENDAGKELFDLPKAPRPGGDVEAPVRFLPDFDNVVMGHLDRRRAVPEEFKAKVFLPGLVVARTFLVDGFVAGTWKVDVAKKKATITVTKLGKKLPPAVLEEAEKLVRFMEPEAKEHAVVRE